MAGQNLPAGLSELHSTCPEIDLRKTKFFKNDSFPYYFRSLRKTSFVLLMRKMRHVCQNCILLFFSSAPLKKCFFFVEKIALFSSLVGIKNFRTFVEKFWKRLSKLHATCTEKPCERKVYWKNFVFFKIFEP